MTTIQEHYRFPANETNAGLHSPSYSYNNGFMERNLFFHGQMTGSSVVNTIWSFCQTDKQTDRQTDRQTNSQTTPVRRVCNIARSRPGHHFTEWIIICRNEWLQMISSSSSSLGLANCTCCLAIVMASW